MTHGSNATLSGAAPRSVAASDPLLAELLGLSGALARTAARILEIGCGDGGRLAWLQGEPRMRLPRRRPFGAGDRGGERARRHAQHGTAEQLPFADGAFDIVMFGFCLYLCDRDDLFRIACEADRVLKNPGWLLILDFYSPRAVAARVPPSRRPVQLQDGLPDAVYLASGVRELLAQGRHHSTGGYTDDPDEWIATSVLRKNLERSE